VTVTVTVTTMSALLRCIQRGRARVRGSVQGVNVYVTNGLQRRSQTTLIEDKDGKQRVIFYFDSDPDGVKTKALGKPPLLLLPGTCQTVSTWQPHISQLSNKRRLIIPEMRCCGETTELLPEIDSLFDFTTDLDRFLQKIKVPVVDVVGFSLGGRVALSLAAHRPDQVRRLSVTGVPLERPVLGDLVLQSWRSGLSSEEAFRGTAWAFVLNGFSEGYLKQNSRNIAHYVDKVFANNDFRKVKVLLSQSHSPRDKAAAINCAHLITCETQIIAATADRISDLQQEERLASVIPNSTLYEIAGAGHLSPFEQPSLWRRLVLNFLDK
jgi:pimeloyl-ACP methyl ester carboxylesterase